MTPLFAFSTVVVLAKCAIPPNFHKCKLKDDDFKTCLLKAAQEGVKQMTKPYKELNLPSIEPLKLTSLTIRARDGVVAVDQYFKDCKVYGLSKMKIDLFELELEKKKLSLNVIVPEEIVKCQYQLDGKVLFLPIQGKGSSTVNLKNFSIKFEASLREVTKNKKTHFKFDNSTVVAKPEQISMYFDNLFNGNKELGDNINQVLNDNSMEIYEEIGSDYYEPMNQVIRKLLNNLVDKVSAEELFG